MEKYTDEQIEKMWIDLEDITMDEDCENQELYLNSDWEHFKTGTYRGDIWEWFNENYSKGLDWLLENMWLLKLKSQNEKVKYTIQCEAENEQIGCFGYLGEYPKSYERVTEVFRYLHEFYDYANSNEIPLQS